MADGERVGRAGVLHLEVAVPALLDTIRNRPPGIAHHRFIHPDGPLPGGFNLEWWISDKRPLLATALTMAEMFPVLRDRHTIPEIEHRVIDIVQKELDHFYWEAFIRVTRDPVVTLLQLARQDGIQSVISALRAWGGESDRSLFLMPVRGLRPAEELLSKDVLWLTPGAGSEQLNALLPLPYLPQSLGVYPPWITGPQSGQKPIGGDDSVLVVRATGLQAGLSELRRAAGAISMAVPDAVVGVRSAPDWANVFELSERGAQILNAFGPILPWLPNVKVLEVDALNVIRDVLADRETIERDRRFRIALESMSAGLVQSGLQEFMSYFIALDALFARANGKWDRAAINHAARRLGDPGAKERIALIIRIRNETVHGQCANIERSRCYLPYYWKFGRHPTEDLLLIVRQCLRGEPPAQC